MPHTERTIPASAPTLCEALDAIAPGSMSARALADTALARIAATEPAVHAWAHLSPERVRAAAAACDRGGAGVLHGAGIGFKDIIDTAQVPTEIGTAIHRGRTPQQSAACVQRVEAAGGYVFGKTVTTAFASLDPGPTRTPWDVRHTPGGSSSGSAAAVGAGHVSAALGTQTNG